MTTIVNTPQPANESGGYVGAIVGLVVFIVIAYVFVMFGLPALQSMKTAAPQINIPSKIDVNVQQTK